MTKEEIGSLLRDKRISCGMTQKEVADKLGRKQPIIGHWETGYSQPDANTLFMLCDIYGTTVDEIFGFKSQKEYLPPEAYDLFKKYRLISEKDINGKALVDSTVNYLCDKIKVMHDKEQDLAEKTNLLSSLQNQLHSQKFQSRLRLYTYVGKITCAGTGFYFDDIPTDAIEAPLMEGADFIIGVNGESMEPTYHDGEKLYIQKISELTLGDVGIFTIRNECFIKELGDRGLISHNPDYDEIEGTEDVRLIGRVLGKVEE